MLDPLVPQNPAPDRAFRQSQFERLSFSQISSPNCILLTPTMIQGKALNRILHYTSSAYHFRQICTGQYRIAASFAGSAQTRVLSSSSLSRRAVAALEDELTAAVGQLKDPILDKSLKALGWLPKRLAVDGNHVTVSLQLPSLLHPELDELKRRIEATATELLHNKGLTVNIDLQASKPFPMHALSTDQYTDYLKALGPALANVSHCLAVYSCKGGVGKSTVAVNLAYELARMGGRVGLLDVDIYGPSLPILVHPDDPAVRKSKIGTSMVLPIVHAGVKLLSLGFVSPDSGVPGSGNAGGAAVMRGPMAARIVAQLLKGTEWGDLDVLVLDLPPGTGDVQLAVCQDLRLTGAVAVTTPSKLALSDAKKGIDMFTSLGVPTLAVVENMSYFVCDGGGKHYPFGKGALEESVKHIFQLPISTLTNNANDAGVPLTLSRPSEASEELAMMENLAATVSRELFLAQHGQSDPSFESSLPHKVVFPNSTADDEFDVASTHLSLNAEGFLARFFSDKGAMQVPILAENLRARHPKTGDIMDEIATGMVQKSPPKLLPAKLDPKGRYGYSVEWADGATIIYSMLSIARAAGAVPT
jgi:Mrp family chromosome partitioning ATPase